MKPVSYKHSWSTDQTQADEMAELFGTLLVEYDTSEAYEQESSHLFKKGTKYYWIDANGCSCWEGDYGGWELTKTELKTLAQKNWDNKYDWRDAADALVARWVLDNL